MNVLLVIVDQLVPFLTGAYGHGVVQTPHLDRLAAEGVRFDAAYTPYPLCSPARAALVTGRYASDLGCYRGMLRPGRGALHDEVLARLPEGERPRVPAHPPVLGAALAALDAVGAPPAAGERLRAAFRAGLAPEVVA